MRKHTQHFLLLARGRDGAALCALAWDTQSSNRLRLFGTVCQYSQRWHPQHPTFPIAPQLLDYLLLIECFIHRLQKGLTLSGGRELTLGPLQQIKLREIFSFLHGHKPLREPSLSILSTWSDYPCLHYRPHLTRVMPARYWEHRSRSQRKGVQHLFVVTSVFHAISGLLVIMKHRPSVLF